MKNVTINEPFFQGHFPDHPIMPGVLIVEAMTQVGGIFAFKNLSATPENKVVYFMGIDKARFRKPVIPGDQVRFELELLKNAVLYIVSRVVHLWMAPWLQRQSCLQ